MIPGRGRSSAACPRPGRSPIPSTYSAALFDTITATDWLLFTVGGRYDHYDTNASAGLTATATTPRIWTNVKNDLWTYNAGVVLKPRPNGSIYFSTSTADVPPGSFLAQGSEDNALTTVGVSPDDLKVQKTTSYEVGTKWDLFDKALSLTLDAFQTKTSNARVANGDGTVSYVGTKRIRGIEFGYNGNVTDKWNVFGGLSYMPSKILSTSAGAAASTLYTVGKPFPNTPKYSFTTYTNYKVTPKLTLGGGAIYMGKVYGGFSSGPGLVDGVTVTKTRATYVPDYWRFDANASYQLTNLIKLQINALNLTNKLYYDQAYATHYAHQAAGRTVIGTVSFRY